MSEAASTGIFAPQVLVYLGMGLMSARMLLEKDNLRGISWLQWLQFFVRAASIVLLWPLALFLERFESWVKIPAEGTAYDDAKQQPAP